MRQKLRKETGHKDIMLLSAPTQDGLDKVLDKLAQMVADRRRQLEEDTEEDSSFIVSQG